MTKYDIRLRYDDCLDSDLSEYVFNFIKELRVIKKTIGICFWYTGDFNMIDVSEKFKKHDIDLDEMNIKFVNMNSIELPVWYDVINESDQDNFNKFKFRSVYSNQKELITCLMQFKNMLIYTLKANLVTIKKDIDISDTRRNNGFKR